MTVLLRTKRSQRLGALPPRARGNRDPGPRAARRVEPPPVRGFMEERLTPPAPQDEALYSCSCGFVFSHEVSTSVACPHCGGAQAW